MEKTDANLSAGTELVLIVNPMRKTARAHRRNQDSGMFSRSRTLDAERDFPGFQLALAQLFRD